MKELIAKKKKAFGRGVGGPWNKGDGQDDRYIDGGGMASWISREDEAIRYRKETRVAAEEIKNIDKCIDSKLNIFLVLILPWIFLYWGSG